MADMERDDPHELWQHSPCDFWQHNPNVARGLWRLAGYLLNEYVNFLAVWLAAGSLLAMRAYKLQKKYTGLEHTSMIWLFECAYVLITMTAFAFVIGWASSPISVPCGTVFFL